MNFDQILDFLCVIREDLISLGQAPDDTLIFDLDEHQDKSEELPLLTHRQKFFRANYRLQQLEKFLEKVERQKKLLENYKQQTQETNENEF